MNSAPDDFETLRKWLALKRHEQPPLGYFDRLPDRIMARLERGEGQSSFWEKLQGHFAFRPAFAFSFALAALSALSVSVFYSVKTEPGETAQAPPNNGWRSATPDEALSSTYNPALPMHVAGWMGNEIASNPASNLPSLFAPGAQTRPVTVSFASPP